ncbi:MAG: bifunctional hydroxymethylpyrimidine kinase/phosphomethylpyrimidine kinase [Rikenellaceae bacterium]|nr:bifunctional hydroxymethylpyrimidine kinase/phosphomethylpyrimidine kinase [Rikenellaceae bacterium]
MELKLNNEGGSPKSHLSHPSAHLRRYPVVLSIAGSDSSGGAGIQADLKTFSALGVYGATAITAITAQNTVGVNSQLAISPEMVYNQIVAVVEDIAPSAIKIGMLANKEVATIVADALSRYNIPTILDPVMVSSSGHRLLSLDAQEVVKERLLPLSTLVTPNIPEMETLTAMSLTTAEEKLSAAQYLLSLGAQAVLLKGGHEEGDTKCDTLYRLDGSNITQLHLSTPTVATKNIHGTGCTLSSAIAAFMARGLALREAVQEAKNYITEAILSGADIAIGNGFGPVNHLFNPLPMQVYEER